MRKFLRAIFDWPKSMYLLFAVYFVSVGSVFVFAAVNGDVQEGKTPFALSCAAALYGAGYLAVRRTFDVERWF